MRFSITAHRGTLAIRPGNLTGFLKPHLRYTYRYTPTEPYVYQDRYGRIVEGQRRTNRVQQVNVNMFNEVNDYLAVHEGLYNRIERVIEAAGHEIVYTKLDPQFPVPTIDPSIMRGLRPEQIECVIEMLSAIGSVQPDGVVIPGGSGALAESTMGSGKTHIIAALCRAYRQKILVTTRSKTVVRRLYRGLSELLEEDGISVGIYQGKDRQIGDVTVGTNKLIPYFDPEDVDCLIFDEVHHACGDQISVDLLRFDQSVKFGLSGTIRNGFDGRDLLVEGLFGPIVYLLTDQEAENLERVCPLKVFSLSVDSGPNTTNWSTPLAKERWGIWRNRFRNKAIVDAIGMVPPHQQLVVFVRTVEHGQLLLDMFPKEWGFEFFHGSLSTSESKRIQDAFEAGEAKRVLATDALGEGVDPAQLMVVIDTCWEVSKKRIAQRAGRVRRLGEGKPFGVLITFSDNFDPYCQRKSKNRLKEYRSRGYEVTESCTLADLRFVT